MHGARHDQSSVKGQMTADETNTFGYLNPFYAFGGVQIIPDKNIQIVKFIFRFSFFLFFLKKIFRLTKNSNFWKKSKKGK